ncbi:hypothetical protein [Halomonas saccharevitans]|uniref:Uncharacterized protein n=1 Tax=Halomonas saccharevitans TaxID=416872 RepID=A0A1I7B3Q3_9GAMM|nr:hypothetical protein [Halomonas saccharevitans]SFT81836.1 hypothetical protein SAMN04487956_12238 [Halomonas saccharevitans]
MNLSSSAINGKRPLIRPFRLVFLSIVVFFVLHPVVYYAEPALHYTGEVTWLVFLRSFLACMIVLVAVFTIARFNFLSVFLLFAFFVFMLVFSFPRIMLGGGRDFLTVFLPSLFLIVGYRYSWTGFRRFFYFASLVNCFFILLDFFWLDGFFSKFDYGQYYRPFGIFVNPNISGVAASLFLYIALSDSKFRYALLALLCIFVTGSKTAYVLSVIALVLFVFCGRSLRGSIFFFLVLVIFFVLLFFGITLLGDWSGGGGGNVRTLDLESMFIRLSMYEELLLDIGLFNYHDSLYSIDNGFFSKVLYGGVFFASVWYFFYLLCFYCAKGEVRIFLFLLLVASITTNLYYTWPLGYFMYFLMGNSLVGMRVGGYVKS